MIKVISLKTLKLIVLKNCIFILFISDFARSQQPALSETQSSADVTSIETSIELDYRLFSPEILYKVGGDLVVMTPKEAGQPGLRYSRGNLSLAYNSGFFSENSQSGGFEISYNWDNWFVQAYHAWASGYQVKLNPDSSSKENLGTREDMTGSSDGLLFLKGFEDDAGFSMMTNHGPRDLENLSTPLQYIYQILVDRSIFSDSTALFLDLQ